MGLPAWDEFLCRMTYTVEQTELAAERVTAAERLLGQLVADPNWLPDRYRVPGAHTYARYPIYLDKAGRFEVIALVWQPGQGTPVHDHDGTWGAEGVLVGQVRVTNYDRVETLPDGKARLRDSGSTAIRAGQTGQLLPPADCHLVANDGHETAVTIHVYGKPLRKFLVFRHEVADLFRTEEVSVRIV